MKICFTSYRPFPDGPVRQPFLENDPANIAYALGGDYFSFYTLASLSLPKLTEKLHPYDLILVALDIEAIELVHRIIETCAGRAATYSEGHIADYQRLSPVEQVAFLKAINGAVINFLYWEKYVPFYQHLTKTPVEYLPYPYLLNEVSQCRLPIEAHSALAVLPSGLAGLTRNGLATLAVAKRLLETTSIAEVACWLEPDTFEQDAQAINYFLFSAPFTHQNRPARLNWRKWLTTAHIDYRWALQLKSKLYSGQTLPLPSKTMRFQNVTLHRRQNWWIYISKLAQACLLIDLNNRETVGRNALDCAALGIACISSRHSDMQARLFPQTTVEDSWDVDTAVTLSQRILRDPDFRREVTAYALDQVQRYAVSAFRQNFRSVCSRYPHILPIEATASFA